MMIGFVVHLEAKSVKTREDKPKSTTGTESIKPILEAKGYAFRVFIKKV